MQFWKTLKRRIEKPPTRIERWFWSRRPASLIVLVYLVGLCVFFGSWLVFLLFLPLYWQVYLKEDLAPIWW